jgi:hypothetical protein
MMPVFERAKPVHALDRAATLIGARIHTHRKVPATYSTKLIGAKEENQGHEAHVVHSDI